MSCDDLRERVDEVAEGAGERRDEQQQLDHDRERDEPEHEDRRARAPAEVELPLHEADDRLEHEGGEEREEERQHRLLM